MAKDCKLKGQILIDHIPVDESDAALHLEGEDGGVDVLGHDVAAVEQAHRHVLPCKARVIDFYWARKKYLYMVARMLQAS